MAKCPRRGRMVCAYACDKMTSMIETTISTARAQCLASLKHRRGNDASAHGADAAMREASAKDQDRMSCAKIDSNRVFTNRNT